MLDKRAHSGLRSVLSWVPRTSTRPSQLSEVALSRSGRTFWYSSEWLNVRAASRLGKRTMTARLGCRPRWWSRPSQGEHLQSADGEHLVQVLLELLGSVALWTPIRCTAAYRVPPSAIAVPFPLTERTMDRPPPNRIGKIPTVPQMNPVGSGPGQA